MKITPRAAFRGFPASSVLLAIVVWCHCVCSIAHARSHHAKTTSSGGNGTELVVDCELVRPFFDAQNVTLAPAAADSPKSKFIYFIVFQCVSILHFVPRRRFCETRARRRTRHFWGDTVGQ